MKKTLHQETSEKLKELFDIVPVDLTNSAVKADREMREGLAMAFGNRGFKSLLENCIRKVNQQLIVSSTPDAMLYYKAQMKVLMELMVAGKTFFVDSELMRNKTDREKALQVERADKIGATKM